MIILNAFGIYSAGSPQYTWLEKAGSSFLIWRAKYASIPIFAVHVVGEREFVRALFRIMRVPIVVIFLNNAATAGKWINSC